MTPTPQTLHICMGSACHQLGVHEVLPRLQQLIREYNLEETLELKGAFCLGVCARGVILKLGETILTGYTAENVERRFLQDILPRVQERVMP